MTILILGLIIFLGIHTLPTMVGARARLQANLGPGGYAALFSLISLLGLVLIVWGYYLARFNPVVIWQPPVWTGHIALMLMPFSFILIAAAYIPGQIKARLHHPMVTGVKVWAFAHLLANGTLADIVLFGAVLAWAVYDRISAGRREREGLIAVSSGPVRNDIIAIAAGLALYLVTLFWLHEWLIGVAPLA